MRKYILFYLMLILLSCVDGNKQYIQDIINDEYSGTIIKIYQDEENHYSYYFDIRLDNNLIKKIRAQSFPDSWKYAATGDFIIKEYGKASIVIKKKDYKKSFDLSIP